MAVYQYQTDKGDALWKSYASVRSKIRPSIRVQRWKLGCKTEKQAKREEEGLFRDCHAEVLRLEASGSTWGAVVKEWEIFQKTKVSPPLETVTIENYVGALNRHTESWWKRSASDITRADVLEVINQMKAKGLSVSHQKTVKVTVNRLFAFGVENGLIRGVDKSPAHGLKLGRLEEKKPEILNLDEIRRLLTEAQKHGHEWRPVWAFALLTGMRNGELYALRWEDIDWQNRVILLSRSYNCRSRTEKCTKAGYWRSIPLSEEAIQLLKELKATAGDRPEVLPRLRRWKEGEQAQILRTFCVGVKLPSIKFHTLRACFATQLIRNGIPPIQIQKICGWKDLKTMQRYIRLAGIEVDGATECLKLLAPAEQPAGPVSQEQEEPKQAA